MTNVAVIGTGYVGLVTGVVLSEIGHTVTCIDIDEKKVEILKSAKSPIYEPGLDELLAKNIDKERLAFTTNHNKAFENAEVIIIAVGTPQSENGAANLDYIEQAARDIAHKVAHDTTVVVKSTVPVGTNDRIEELIKQELKANVKVQVVSNPEFLREGHAIHDTFYGDRIVIGSETNEAGDIIEELFQPLNLPVVRTNRRSAEMIKYASNAFLAVKISFINQISNLCEKLEANVNDVADGMGMDQRIGRSFLNAGLGYGGSCFPKDTEALSYLARENDVNLNIVDSAIHANKEQRKLFVNKVLNHFNSDVKGKKIAILGLAFKPNTDDMREAPSVTIIQELVTRGAIIAIYDPVVKYVPTLGDMKLTYSETLIDCIRDKDAVLIVTEWEEFINYNWNVWKKNNEKSTIFDGRNIFKIEV